MFASRFARLNLMNIGQIPSMSKRSNICQIKTAMISTKSDFKSIKYWVDDRVAHIQLNRPARLNAIDIHMPFELENAVDHANADENVKVNRKRHISISSC